MRTKPSIFTIVLPMLALGFFLYASSSSAAEPAPKTLPKAVLELPVAKTGEMRTAVLAGGCFWCEEAAFEQLRGVSAVVAGYAGGTAATATYDSYHDSNHAEAVQITYDPAQVSYGELLRVLFTAGDPTTVNGQHPYYGRGYRMAIFYADADQKKAAEAYVQQISAAKIYAKPIAVTVEPMPEGFFAAEEYHQHYVARHPEQPYVRQWSRPKIALVRAAFPELIAPAVPAAGANGKPPAGK